jgi:hypothetical protein
MDAEVTARAMSSRDHGEWSEPGDSGFARLKLAVES